MNEFEQPFTDRETSQHKSQRDTTAKPSPATWSGQRKFEPIMRWLCRPEQAATPRLRLDETHTYWSLN